MPMKFDPNLNIYIYIYIFFLMDIERIELKRSCPRKPQNRRLLTETLNTKHIHDPCPKSWLEEWDHLMELFDPLLENCAVRAAKCIMKTLLLGPSGSQSSCSGPL